MTTHFDRWEKDPFFSAAEEVQESADRMESTYRTWLHAKKETSGLWNVDELRRDLQTTLGTTKWQLEEFEKAVNSSYKNGLVNDSKNRHKDFVVAMDSQIKKVEKSINECPVSHGKPPKPWMRLDENELDELTSFLSGTSAPSPGHRRSASAGADIGSWKISVAADSSPPSSTNEQPGPSVRKVPSLSGFLNTMESATNHLKWPMNGYRKLKLLNRGEEADMLPQSKLLTKVTNDGCDDCYGKQLHGWYGAVQRQLQRSQYHVQYNRPLQIVFSIILLFCVIGISVNLISFC